MAVKSRNVVRKREVRPTAPRPAGRMRYPAAKVTVPRLQGAIARERLFLALDEHASRALTWVAAAPGAGKTILVASYLERCAHHVIWYRADTGDLDLPSVFHHLRSAAFALAPEAAASLPLLTPEYSLDIATFARNFFRALFAMVEPHAAVVFDNFHDAAPGTLDIVLPFAVAESTADVRLFAISRQAPPPPVVALQVSGHLAVLSDSLVLTTPEATAIAAAMRIEDEQLIRRQLELSEGWAAGFVLLLQSSKELGAKLTSAATPAPPALFHYFSQELFAAAPESSQRVLLCTALLPQFTISQAGALAGMALAERVIRSVYESNFFIDRLEGPEPVYRYHDLFREFLLEQGRATFTPSERSMLLKQATDAAERAGNFETALCLAIECCAWEDAVRLVAHLAPGVLERGRNLSLVHWIESLPPGVVRGAPWMQYWQGAARLAFDPISGRELLQKAYTQFEQRGDRTGCLLSCAGILQSFFLLLSDQHGVDEWLRNIRDLLQAPETAPPPDLEAQVLPALTGVMMRHLGDPLLVWADARARFLLDQPLPAARQIPLIIFLITHCMIRGQWTYGAALLGRLDRLLPVTLPPLMQLTCTAARITWHAMCADYASEARGRAEIERFIDLSTNSGVRVLDPYGLTHAVYFALNWRDRSLASSLLERLRRSVPPARTMHETQYCWLAALVALDQGDPAAAAAHNCGCLEQEIAWGSRCSSAAHRLLAAQIACANGHSEVALQHLDEVIAYGRLVDSIPYEHAGLLIKAYVLLRNNQHGAGLAALREGLELGRRTGQSVLAPAAHSGVVQYVYTEALRREVEVDYVRKLIRTFHIPARELDIPHWPWPIRIYTLGRFAILKDDVAIRVCGKAEQRPIDLLVALIALGGREVSIRELLIQVWPQLGPNARAAFDVALMRLRRSLGAEVVEVGRGRLTLNNACCWVDAWAFERIAARATKDRSPEVYECVLERYRGPFMREETEIPCVVAMRDRLATKFQRSVLQAGQAFERSGDFDRAAEAYRAGLEHDNLVEEFHRRLIYCEWKLGHRAEALKSYRRCKDLLRLHLHTGPSPETRALYRDLIVDPPP